MMFIFKHTKKTWPLLIVFALLTTGLPGLHAQQNDKVYKVGEQGVTAPKPRSNVQPGYTDEAQANGVMGEVTISFEIDTNGKTRNIKVVKGLDPGLDRNAVAAVREWLFEPATKDGQPVICEAKTQVNFKLQ